MLKWLLILACLWLNLARAEVTVPPLQARVADQTATLDAAAVERLEGKLAALERARGAQIAVLIVPTTRPERIEQYSLRVAEAWKLGRKGVDDGALLLIAKNDRSLRIEVGYGLEGVIPDAVAKRIVSEIIVPRFKTGDYVAGIDAGVDALIKLVSGEPLPQAAPGAATPPGIGALLDMLPAALLFIFIFGSVLRMIFGRLLGAGIAGGVVFAAAWLLLGFALLLAVILAALAFFFVFVEGAGRGFGSGGFGGGGGGGFSGGGGGFGGGGASGSW